MLKIDKNLLNSFGQVSENIERFYLQARKYFVENKTANYTDAEIVKAAQKNNLLLMGGPMLGNLKSDGVSIWLRQVTEAVITVKLSAENGTSEKEVQIKKTQPGKEKVLKVSGLKAKASYAYKVLVGDKKVAEGNFSTAPEEKTATEFKVAFGSCFHKIGLHNPTLVEQIINRKSDAMLFVGRYCR